MLSGKAMIGRADLEAGDELLQEDDANPHHYGILDCAQHLQDSCNSARSSKCTQAEKHPRAVASLQQRLAVRSQTRQSIIQEHLDHNQTHVQ